MGSFCLFSVVNLQLASKSASKDQTIQIRIKGLFLYEDECVTVLYVTSVLYSVPVYFWVVGRRYCLDACHSWIAILKHILGAKRHILNPSNQVDSYQDGIYVKGEVGEVYLALV